MYIYYLIITFTNLRLPFISGENDFLLRILDDSVPVRKKYLLTNFCLMSLLIKHDITTEKTDKILYFTLKKKKKNPG